MWYSSAWLHFRSSVKKEDPLELITFLLGLALLPLALFGTFGGVLFTLLAVAAFGVGLVGVHTRNYWVSTLMLIALFVGGAWGASAETTSFWASVFAVTGEALSQLGVYIALGLAASFPLWMWHVRNVCHARAKALSDYCKQCVDGYTGYARTESNGRGYCEHNEAITVHRFIDKDVGPDAVNFCKTYRVGQQLPEELEAIWKEHLEHRHATHDGEYIADLSIVATKNVSLITSYALFWPWHLVDVIFGDILAKLPRYFVRVFARVYDACGRIARFGLPKNI